MHTYTAIHGCIRLAFPIRCNVRLRGGQQWSLTADVVDLYEEDEGEIAKALSRTSQLPPSFHEVLEVNVGDLAKGVRVSLPQHVRKRHSLYSALLRFSAQ